MEISPLISILIPVYNGKEFLEKTISSIQEQSFRHYEVICIDDNSNDGSYEYLISISKNDNRFKIVKRKDKGGNAAKGISYGLPFCNGKYFFYMSQDDFISNDCLEKCFCRIEETGADICIPDTVLFTGNAFSDQIMRAPNNNYDQVISGKEAFYLSVIYKISGFALRRLDLVKKIGQDDHYYDSCDKSMAFQYFFANKVSFCDTKFFYRQNNQNAITKLFSVQYMHHLDTCNEVLEFSIKHNVKYSYIKEFVSVFITRRKTFLKKILSLKEKDLITGINILNKSLHNMRILLLRKGYFFLYLETISLYYLKNKTRIFLYLFLKKNKLTKNFLFRNISNTLEKKGFLKSITEENKYKKNLYDVTVKKARSLPCKIGKCTYCGENIFVGSSETTIGSFCSLASNIIIGPGEHPINYLSTSPFLYMNNLGYTESQGNEIFLKSCKIGNDVWIGDNVFIKGGVNIGDGAIIGAGAIVTKDVPAYAIVGGVPAKLIRYRFDDEIICKLLKIKWWDFPDKIIRKIPFRNIDEAIAFLENYQSKSINR